jgi:hypothetical protein
MAKPWLTPQALPTAALDWLASYTGTADRLPFEARKFFDQSVTASILEQARGLQKARSKLPTLAAIPYMLFPRVSVEQATPEPIARGKFEQMAGDCAIDLTAGLGVDAWQLAQRFRRVVACEREAALVEVLRYNFLHVFPQSSLIVEQTNGLDYLASQTVIPDLIYLDPARRNATGRVVRWSELQPDPVACWPDLFKATRRWVVLKLSPLTDLAEALRVFPEATSVVCRSLGGEVKEVSIVLDKASEQKGQVVAEVFETNTKRIFCLPDLTAPPGDSSYIPLDTVRGFWLWVPDAALRHSRLAAALAQHTDLSCKRLNHGAYFIFQEKHIQLAGNWWYIREILEKRQVRDWLRAEGIKQALVHALMLPDHPDQLAQKWKIHQGGFVHLVVVQDECTDRIVVCY